MIEFKIECLTVKNVVNCRTREESDNLLNWAKREGYYGPPLNAWERWYEKETCYECYEFNGKNLGFRSVSYYASKGFNIIPYEQAILKGENTMQEEKLKRIESIEKELAELKASIKKETKVEGDPCVTPVNCRGDILFNDNKQTLSIDRGLYNVSSYSVGYEDCKDQFVWIPCEREDLEEGDTAFRTNSLTPIFPDLGLVCKILDAKKDVSVSSDEDTYVMKSSWDYWYKLIPKNGK